MSNRWSAITDQIRSNLPHWWTMRRDKNSTGAQFLNVIGLTLEDVEYLLDYAKQQYYIMTADVGQVDIVYKTTLPSSVTSSMNLQITGQGYLLQETTDMNTFLTGLSTDVLSYEELFYNNPYYVDWAKQTLYVRKPYETTTDMPEGSLLLNVLDSSGNTIILDRTLPLHIHHVWNFFDEFGLLLDTPRLYGEKNDSYIKRILDVFRHPANASYHGLLNGIARELSLTHEDTWQNDQTDFMIYRPRVVTGSIEVDSSPLASTDYYIDDSGRTILLGNPNNEGISHTVTYASGLDAYRIQDKDDPVVNSKLYTATGTASPLLKYYVDTINKQVPVMWGQFVFGNVYWDIAKKDMSGTGFLPVILDADFMKWQTYIPKG